MLYSNWRRMRHARMSGLGRPCPPTSNARGLSAIESFGQASNAKLLVSDCRDRVAGVHVLASCRCLLQVQV